MQLLKTEPMNEVSLSLEFVKSQFSKVDEPKVEMVALRFSMEQLLNVDEFIKVVSIERWFILHLEAWL